MTKLKNSVLFTIGAICFLTLWSVSMSHGAMTDCIDATCRITATDGGMGSGCVFEISQGRVYVLTAAHVVGKDRTVRCEFWRQGHQSQPLEGEVIALTESADAAIVAVPEGAFEGVLPSVIPIAPRGYIVPAGATLSSVGCANGTWSTGWKGHALGYSGADLHFLPTPANGRSGSAVFDAEGKMIVAVLRARTVNDSEGIATSVQCIYDAFGKESRHSSLSLEEDRHSCLSPKEDRHSCLSLREGSQEYLSSTLVQCPGGACPGGACPTQPGSTPYLLPYRYREQNRNQQQSPSQPAAPLPAWPTLPIGQSNTADLGQTNQKLDKIADSLDILIKSKTAEPVPVQSTSPPPAPIDETARKTADEAKAQATAVKTQIEKFGEQTKVVSDKFGKIDDVLSKFGADPETLIQRALDRVNKVKAELGSGAEPDDVVKAYAKDLIRERIKEGVSGLTFDKLVSVGGGIPAVGLAIFGCVVVWKLVNNKPLAIESLAPNSFAGQAATQIREHVAAAVEPIKTQFEAKLSQITGVAADAQAAANVAKTVSQIAAASAGQSTAQTTTK
jgi:hypothetical protein